MNRALIVRKPWIDLILSGEKMWEMRSAPTKIRGRIGLIEAGSGLIVGECDLSCVLDPIDEHDAYMSYRLHRVKDVSLLEKWKYPWVMTDPKRYQNPIPYQHPKGAVIWVKLPQTQAT